jgi:predicted phosphodiesterase
MRVAALYDIHGNLPALEAVLGEVRHAGVDRIVVGGDVIPGPMAHDTIACLLSVPTPIEFIRGNGEVAVLEQLAGTESPAVPEPYRAAMRWTANDIRADYAAVVAGWPATVELELPAGRVLFCHATPRNENEIFTAATPEQRLVPVFGGLTVPVVVCGHTHMQFDRMVGGTRVVNAGSVGMPFGAPGADWLLLGEGDTGIQLRHTDYDLQAAAARVRDTAFPWPEDFAARHILRPPSAAEMLDVFARASL